MLLTQKLLRRILGVLWLVDAILQVQPQMFTANMIDSVLLPTLNTQPAPVAASLSFITVTISKRIGLSRKQKYSGKSLQSLQGNSLSWLP